MQKACTRACASFFSWHHQDMDKQTAIKKAGSVQALATLLDVSHQAVYAWGDEVPKRSLQLLRLLRPEWFQKRGKARQEPAQAS